MNLADLPPELIAKLPDYLHSLDDWYALIRTSRCFYKHCSTTKAKFAPTFPKNHPLTPHPHFILAGSACQIADWAVEEKANYQRLCATFPKGNKAMLDLALEVTRWTIDDIRTLHRAKIDVITPVWNAIIKDGGLKERNPDPQPVDIETSLYNYLIYCNLFHHSINSAYINFPIHIEPLYQETRIEWMLHCMLVPQNPVYKEKPGSGPERTRISRDWSALTIGLTETSSRQDLFSYEVGHLIRAVKNIASIG